MPQPKSYPAPWQGHLILACRKCQKKLKGKRQAGQLGKLRKAAKHHAKHHPNFSLDVINVSCMDLCPKDGVTICDVSRDPSRLQILRNEDDLLKLAQSKANTPPSAR